MAISYPKHVQRKPNGVGIVRKIYQRGKKENEKKSVYPSRVKKRGES